MHRWLPRVVGMLNNEHALDAPHSVNAYLHPRIAIGDAVSFAQGIEPFPVFGDVDVTGCQPMAQHDFGRFT